MSDTRVPSRFADTPTKIVAWHVIGALIVVGAITRVSDDPISETWPYAVAGVLISLAAAIYHIRRLDT